MKTSANSDRRRQRVKALLAKEKSRFFHALYIPLERAEAHGLKGLFIVYVFVVLVDVFLELLCGVGAKEVCEIFLGALRHEHLERL